jgi:cysteine desulfurase
MPPVSASGTRTYLDFNAGTPVLAEAVAAAIDALRELGGNPSSPHAEGRRARRLLAAARKEVARLIGAQVSEVVFVSGGTEANVAALWGLVAADGTLSGRRLVVGATEHPAVAETADRLARLGVDVETLPVDGRGLVRLDELGRLVGASGGGIVAVQLANQETGVIQPVEEVARRAHALGARVHCDAVQGVGRMPVDFTALGVDTLALAGHKLGAPPGAGALVVRGGVEIAPLIPGSQEAHRRGGTENAPAIAGLGAAAGVARERLAEWVRVASLRDELEAGLARRLPGSAVLGVDAPRLPNTTCVVLPAPLRGDAMVAALDLEGIAVSSGPACSSGVERRSAVAEAMGLDGEEAERTVRISLGTSTARAGVDAFLDALARVVGRAMGGAP